MKVDLHIHTKFSDCSNFALEEYISLIKSRKLKAITVTDHGTIEACKYLSKNLPNVMVIFGIEVKAQEGDFLLFSDDIEYLGTLRSYTKSLKDLRNNSNTAIIWAHPRLSSSYGWKSPVQKTSFLDKIMDFIDGIEVYNGNMLSQLSIGLIKNDYVSDLERIASDYQKACIGGSDSHTNGKLLQCWTEFPPDSYAPIDFIKAIKNNTVTAGYDKGSF